MGEIESAIDRLRQVGPGTDWVMVDREALAVVIEAARATSHSKGAT